MNISLNKESAKYELIDKILLLTLITSTFLFPKIVVGESYPAFRIEDILLLPIILRLIQIKPEINFHIKLISLFGLYILFVIMINGRMTRIRDYFEICKLMKLAILIVFLSQPQYLNFIKKLFLPIFGALIAFNLLHFFNVFDFNTIIEKYYSPEHHLKYFGLNSDFTVSTKRLLGTMGNPNNNGILFLFFIVQFLPLKLDEKMGGILLYLIAVFACIHTQSRTAFIALGILFIAHSILKFTSIKKYAVIFLAFIVLLFADFYNDNLLYLWSLRGARIQVENEMEFKTNNHSLQSRFEIWQHLYGMIKQKPLLGHAPYKEYFYENELYSENEYILMTWRYGIVGLLFFITMISYPVYKAYKEKNIANNIKLFTFISCILLTALTNNPLSEPRILVMYSIMAGMFYAETIPKKPIVIKAI